MDEQPLQAKLTSPVFGNSKSFTSHFCIYFMYGIRAKILGWLHGRGHREIESFNISFLPVVLPSQHVNRVRHLLSSFEEERGVVLRI